MASSGRGIHWTVYISWWKVQNCQDNLGQTLITCRVWKLTWNEQNARQISKSLYHNTKTKRSRHISNSKLIYQLPLVVGHVFNINYQHWMWTVLLLPKKRVSVTRLALRLDHWTVVGVVTHYIMAHVVFCHESTSGESWVFILGTNCLMYSDCQNIRSV